MLVDQFIYVFTNLSDMIQLSCDYLLTSDLLLNFPDWNGSWWYINDLVLNTCEDLGYISEHCNLYFESVE